MTNPRPIPSRQYRVADFALLALAMVAATPAGPLHAVQLSQTGAGQVLLFPYYTVRNGFVTQVTVVNTQANTKALKIRFHEAYGGRDVFDFNVFLSPNDTWTGAVVETAQGARVVSNDNSCVTPSDLFGESRIDYRGLPLNAFKNYMYTGAWADVPQDASAFQNLDRTREGYFEVIEMGVIDPGLSATAERIAGYIRQNDASGVPANCAVLDRFDPGAGQATQFPNAGAAMMAAPRGGVTGRASLINAATGANYSFTPTALDTFSNQVVYGAAGAGSPTLVDASPATSVVSTPDGQVIATWAKARDAVSAVLMREAVANEFVIDRGTASQTEWIVTFPTKPWYTDRKFKTSLVAEAPFSRERTEFGGNGCERYMPEVTDRDGRSGFLPGYICPATYPPARGPTRTLCYAAGVLPMTADIGFENFVASELLGTPRPEFMGGSCPVPGIAFALWGATTTPGSGTTPAFRGSQQGPNGYVSLTFAPFDDSLQPRLPLTPLSATRISNTGVQTSIPGVHYGLPMIGFMLHNYKNANVASRYGGVLEHRYTVRIE